MTLGERYEAACAEAARLYAAGKDTTAIDAECDELQQSIELERACVDRFKHLSLAALVRRIERAADFGYDDESIALQCRLSKDGKTWRWASNDRIEIT